LNELTQDKIGTLKLSPKFPVHGRCQIITDNNIIIIDALGPWNLEFFEILHSNLQQTVQSNFQNKTYGIVVVLKGETLATQEGLNYHLEKVTKGNAKAIAINMMHSSFALTTQIQFEAVYNKAGLKNKFFHDTSSAKQWIESLLLSQ
jgi:hypothetical protein